MAESVTPTQVIRAGILAGSSFYDADTGELVATTATARAALAALDELEAERDYYLAAFDAAAETIQKVAGDA